MNSSKGNIIPAIRYKNAPAALDWLCEAFGFERRLVVPGEPGTIAHAQLTLGNGMIMVSSVSDDEFGNRTMAPVDGRVTQSPYVIVADVDAHYKQAKAAGAEIVLEISDQPHNQRMYSARDPEGHLWNFGRYDPWAM